MAESKRQRYEFIRAQLEQERSSFVPHWRELNDHINPRRGRFFTSDVNKGDRRNQKIYNSAATLACRTTRSGMMGGITSPARPWKRLALPDRSMSEISAVKAWLDMVNKRMDDVFLKSNLYNVLPIIYGDIATFGTSAMSIEEDMDDVVRFYPFPIGSYMIANNDRLKVDVFFREFRMTVRQLVQRFGQKSASGEIDWSNFSVQVKQAYETHQLEQWIDVCHMIQPNAEFDPNKMHSKHKRYSSCYYERGTATSQGAGGTYSSIDDRFLSEKGYDFFPVLCPRWEVTGEDVYGTDCPGMTALGDIKALQVMEKRKAQAIEKMVNPPMIAPVSMKNAKLSILPGDTSFSDAEQNRGFRPAHEVNIRIGELEQNMQQIERRISRCFFEDLFLMLANDARSGITAREIEERHEEKLLALGPVLEQLNQDLLDPLIEITFEIMLRRGMIPDPPEELQGMDLKVEYISVMAQAQKLVGIAGIERFAGFAANAIQANPELIDKIDGDQMLDVYADMTSVPQGIVRSDDDVAAIRQNRAKAQQQQAQIEQAGMATQAAKNLSQADMEGDNALTRMMSDAQAGNVVPNR